MRRNNATDRLIREKLSRVAPVPANGDWEKLLNRMAQHPDIETENAVRFDQIIREKTPLSAPHPPKGQWDSLLKNLNGIYWRERQILKSKAIELTGILLLLLFVDGHFAHRPTIHRPIVSHTKNQPAFTGSILAKSPLKEASPNTSGPIRPLPSLSSKGLISLQSAYTTDFLSYGSPVKNLLKPTGSLIAPLSALVLQQVRPLSVSAFHMQKSLPEEPPAIAKDTRITSSSNASDASGKIVRLKPKSFATLSMFGGADINLVITDASLSKPAGPVLSDISIPAYVRYTLGYSGGASFSFGKGRTSIASGLIYTAKQYQARPVFYISGSLSNGFYGEGITNIEHNIITIPLQLRYDFLSAQNWVAYGAIGGNMHLVMESNYTVAGENAFRNSDFNPPAYAFDHSGLTKKSVLNINQSGKGWLQGGGFTNNTFFSSSLALGLERRFNNGFTFFAQPTYYHAVWHLSRHGLGPDHERIHTLSVYTGVRIRLK